jgi:phenylacetate-coenzyme A ligase PaaK-like adenylate-forming protein
VVVSDLHGEVLPMVRYRLRDLAIRRSGAACACGRSLPTLEVAIGREGSFIRLPSGRKVFSTMLAYSVIPTVASFRARQESTTKIDAQVTLHHAVNPETAKRDLEAAWRNALGNEIEIEVRVVTTIAPEPSGKLRYFIPLES